MQWQSITNVASQWLAMVCTAPCHISKYWPISTIPHNSVKSYIYQ